MHSCCSTVARITASLCSIAGNQHMPTGRGVTPIDPQTIIEIEGALEDEESIARTVTIAERQAEMLASTILECLDPVKLAHELVH
jgi:hypothetical protein